MSESLPKHVTFKVLKGGNRGDVISLDLGVCRLVGRHLGEHETVMLSTDGNRVLDSQEVTLFESQLHASSSAKKPKRNKLASFKRGSDIVLSDETVSRAHAMLFYDENGAGLVDLASTNGTMVNGESLTAALLEDGDVIKCGSTILEVSVKSSGW